MSVILAIEKLTISQGWSGSDVESTLTNSGDENIKNVRLKVIDPSVFSQLTICRFGSSHGMDCLNRYTWTNISNESTGGESFPAETTSRIILRDITVKNNAPIQDNPLACYWQYIVY